MSTVACAIFTRPEEKGPAMWLRPFVRADIGTKYLDASIERFKQSFENDANSPQMFRVMTGPNEDMRITNMSSFFRHCPVYGMCLAPGEMVQKQYASEIVYQASGLTGCSFADYFVDGSEPRGGAVLWWDEGRDLVWSVSAELLRLVYARLQFDAVASDYKPGDVIKLIVPLRHYPNDVARWKHTIGQVLEVRDKTVCVRETGPAGRTLEVDASYILTKAG